MDTLGVKGDNRSRFDLSDWGKLTWTYGAEYSQDKQTGTDSATADGSRGGVPDATADFAGVFTQTELKIVNPDYLLGELTILPGVRFDRFTNEAVGEVEFRGYGDLAEARHRLQAGALAAGLRQLWRGVPRALVQRTLCRRRSFPPRPWR